MEEPENKGFHVLRSRHMLMLLLILFVVATQGIQALSSAKGLTRPPPGFFVHPEEPSINLPADDSRILPPDGYNAPEQVHITQGDQDGHAVIISWVTPSAPGNAMVRFGRLSGTSEHVVKGSTNTYTFNSYSSGHIHHVLLNNLEHNTAYYYIIGARNFTFTTPPEVHEDSAFKFGIMGDLGQTYASWATLEHYLHSDGQAVLFLGDMCYADTSEDPQLWDTWARLVEPSTAFQSWIWTGGNHEIEFEPELGEVESYKAFLSRYRTPYESSDSTNPLWYSINVASVHIIVLSSYSPDDIDTPQWTWLKSDFEGIDRSRTPWVIVLLHTPWYNSNENHYLEGEPMRMVLEEWFVFNHVDIVFSGHVHAYERSKPITTLVGEPVPRIDPTFPTYINVGDGGNIEGISKTFMYPQPSYSAFRHGHGMLEIKNKTHAFFQWHRNQDAPETLSDSVWITNQYNRY